MKTDVGCNRYILDGKVPVPCEDLLTWAHWIETDANRIVKQEYVGPVWVSTVFLGLDHNFLRPNGPPMLFETMLFRDANDIDRAQWKRLGWKHHHPEHVSIDDAPSYRSSTWELALEAHEEAVAWAKKRLQ